jgi:hypothetical protein
MKAPEMSHCGGGDWAEGAIRGLRIPGCFFPSLVVVSFGEAGFSLLLHLSIYVSQSLPLCLLSLALDSPPLRDKEHVW